MPTSYSPNPPMATTPTISTAAATDSITAQQRRRRSAGAYAPPRMLALPPSPPEAAVKPAESESPWYPCTSKACRSLRQHPHHMRHVALQVVLSCTRHLLLWYQMPGRCAGAAAVLAHNARIASNVAAAGITQTQKRAHQHTPAEQGPLFQVEVIQRILLIHQLVHRTPPIGTVRVAQRPAAGSISPLR